MVANLRFQNGAMTGVLSGKSLLCYLHSAQGASLPAGQYVIRGPLQDPIYGPVIIMSAIGGGTAGGQVMTDGGITAGRVAVMGDSGITVFYKDGDDGVNRTSRSAGGLAMDDWTQGPGAVAAYEWDARPGGSAFIVSGAPIPGRNCLVANVGLPDLMDALKTAGSALISVD